MAVAWLFPSIHSAGQEWHTFNMPMFKNHHSAIAASNGKIYLFGGGSTTGDCTNEVYEFNPADGSFTLKAPMPERRCGAAVEEWNGKIYLFGGSTEFIGTATNTVFEYDIATNSFKTISSPMPTARGYASASRLNDTIFVTGGGINVSPYASKVVEKFYPKGSSWLPAGATLVNTRGAHTSHTVGENIYVLCGTYSDPGPLHTTIEKYNPNTGNWVVEESNVTSRLFHSSCKAGQKIYIMGGYDGPPIFSSVDVYNPTGLPRWETLDSMNTARRGFAAASVPITGGYRIYVFGGNGYSGVLNTAEYYDIKDLSWTRTTDMPVLKNHHSAIAASNGKIYLFGGGSTTGGCTNEVYEFNPADSSFTLKAPMPGLRCGAAVEEWNGKIYLFGGYSDAFGGTITNSVLEYNINGNAWSTLSNVMPTARAYASATALSDGKIYVMGGDNKNLVATNAVEVFDAAGGNWLPSAPSLRKGRGGHVSHEVDGKVYVVGGASSLLAQGAEKTVEMWDPASGSAWVVVDSIPTPRFFLSSCKGLDDKIYAIGGYNYGVGPTLSSVDIFDPDGTPRWDTILSMNEARRGGAAACVPITDGFRIFVFGGNNETSVLKTVEYIDIYMTLVPNREIAEASHAGPQLLVFPNPANGMATMLYNLPASGWVQISLYDNSGRLVRTLMKADQPAGNHSLEFDTSVLPKGIFFGLLRTERGETAHMKLIVQ